MSAALDLMDHVCSEFKTTPQSLISRRREARLVHARRYFSWLASEGLGLSSTEIGRLLGKDHSTILHHLKVIREGRG